MNYEKIIDQNFQRYAIQSKNIDYISKKELKSILEYHKLIGEFPPSLAIFQAQNKSFLCTNKEDIAEVVGYRVLSYEKYINEVIKEYNVEFKDRSCFIIEVAEGAPERNLFSDLRTVCLSGSVPNAKKTQAIPFVDAYYAGNPNNYFEKIEFSQTKWRNKKDSLVWRGGGCPTLLTKIPNTSAEWTHQRLKFCQKHFKNFDVGFHEVNPSNWGVPYRPFKKERLSHNQMSEYKFIAQVQGITSCYDAPLWIMASGSIMIWIIDEEQETLNSDLPTWTMWYYDMLKPYEHYVPSTINRLKETIAWCLDNQEKCLEIIENSKQIQKNIMSISELATAYLLRKISNLI